MQIVARHEETLEILGTHDGRLHALMVETNLQGDAFSSHDDDIELKKHMRVCCLSQVGVRTAGFLSQQGVSHQLQYCEHI